MKVAHVLAFQESRPIELRGSRGRVVSYLAEELMAQGHEVVLLAEATPETLAGVGCDVVHFHLDRAAIPAAWQSGWPAVATLHAGGTERSPETSAIDGVPLVAISEVQRSRLPSLPWSATIPQGIPEKGFEFREGRGGYLAVSASMQPGSGIDRAIEIARRSGRRLRIALEPSQPDEAYFHDEVAPLLADPHVTLIGELEAASRNQFLGDAVALLQLSGGAGNTELTAIEALASGTPIVRCGAFAEQESLGEGIVDLAAGTLAQAVDAVSRVDRLERRRCRDVFERRFTAAQVARLYLALYRAVQRTAPGPAIPLAMAGGPGNSAEA